jgi:hypothetical protein
VVIVDGSVAGLDQSIPLGTFELANIVIKRDRLDAACANPLGYLLPSYIHYVLLCVRTPHRAKSTYQQGPFLGVLEKLRGRVVVQQMPRCQSNISVVGTAMVRVDVCELKLTGPTQTDCKPCVTVFDLGDTIGIYRVPRGEPAGWKV